MDAALPLPAEIHISEWGKCQRCVGEHIGVYEGKSIWIGFLQ